jgi:hypothetical protein
MAISIQDHGKDNVVPIKRGRGRPKGTTKVTANARAADAAKQAEQMVGGAFVEQDAGDTEPQAPAFGANELDAGGFLQWVKKLNEHEDKGEEIKLKLKAWRTDRKLLRKEANGAGIILGQLDEALEDLKTEQVDIAAREERRRQYHEWLGIPFAAQAELFPTASLDAEQEAKRWFKAGDVAGRLGKIRKQPAGIPAEHVQDWLRGYEAGQTVLMQNSPLTAGAFDAGGKLKEKNDQPPVTAPVGDKGILVLSEEHFVAGTILDDANLKTLIEEHHAAFHASDRVVALFGTSRRILREPNDDGTFYTDDGEQDTEVTQPEPVGADFA